MNAVTKLTPLVSFLILPVLFGCSNDNLVTPSSAPELSEETLAKRLPNQNQKQKAINMAEKFLSSEGVLQTNGEWASSAKIVDAFPVYMDGVQDVCYYECKISSNGKEAHSSLSCFLILGGVPLLSFLCCVLPRPSCCRST